ncbi:MAG TPA: glucose-6-phosphate isomerase [Bacteroidales bacterium]|nr:glucose-6-phosphate isomerase [Bacteroidales bacterium]
MENISINLKNCSSFISLEEVMAFARLSLRHLNALNSGTGPGSDYLGWLTLPTTMQNLSGKIEKAAMHLRFLTDTTVVIGIGGSYLGSRAVIEALSHSFHSCLNKKEHEILFAGQNIDEDYLSDLLEVLEHRNYSIIVISKSGTTTEPAIAFRVLKDHLEMKVGKVEAAERIIAITDEKKGALREMAELNGYETFEIPDDVGGRYSVLTPVGLLPIAVSGFNISNILKGAASIMELTRMNKNAESNPALIYASIRNLLLQDGKLIEILVNFTPRLHSISEWWKQLFAESEGKDGKGIFPASLDMTTDLHSLGQYIQDGHRVLFETVLSVKSPTKKLVIPPEKDDADQLNYLAGKRLSEVNKKAEAGTIIAHNDGKVPVIQLEIPSINEYYLGQLIYMMEVACGISGYILDVNPFDQPGVEAYKKNMFALLNKPGYEEEGKILNKRL